MIIVVLLLILSISLVSIALQNTVYLPLSYLAWTINSSLAVYIIAAFVIGLAVGLFLAIPNLVKKSLKLSGQNKNLSSLKKELEEIKNKPNQSPPNLPNV